MKHFVFLSGRMNTFFKSTLLKMSAFLFLKPSNINKSIFNVILAHCCRLIKHLQLHGLPMLWIPDNHIFLFQSASPVVCVWQLASMNVWVELYIRQHCREMCNGLAVEFKYQQSFSKYTNSIFTLCSIESLLVFSLIRIYVDLLESISFVISCSFHAKQW